MKEASLRVVLRVLTNRSPQTIGIIQSGGCSLFVAAVHVGYSCFAKGRRKKLVMSWTVSGTVFLNLKSIADIHLETIAVFLSTDLFLVETSLSFRLMKSSQAISHVRWF